MNIAPFSRPLEFATDPRPGVNLVGFLEAESGLGEIARRLGAGLEHARIPFAAIAYRNTPSRQEHPRTLPVSHEVLYDTNLICLNADYMHEFVSDASVDFFVHRYSIGVWFWETSVFRPKDRAALRFLDEVWVASEYARSAVTAAVDVPVEIVPIPIEQPPPAIHARSDLGVPEGFVFLAMFDFVSVERKNPIAVVEAFRRAFGPTDGARLVLKSINGHQRKPEKLAELQEAIADRPDIVALDGYVHARERDSYFAACDCFVSLHRSEGLGLTMAEAMARGKPVIATGYSGNLEFMDAESSYLVPYALVPVPESWWAHAPDAEWAEPDVDTAAALMREVFEDRAGAAVRGELGRARVLDTLSLDRAAAFMSDRMSAIRSRTRARATSPKDLDTRAPILQISRALEAGVGASLLADVGRQRLVSRLLARALWPYLSERHRLDGQMLDALSALQRRVDDLGVRMATLEGTSAGAKPPHDADV